MSKSYALAGIRFGFAIAQPAVIEQLAKVKDSYNCDAIAIAAATAAIADQEWLKKIRVQFGRREHDLPPTSGNLVFCGR